VTGRCQALTTVGYKYSLELLMMSGVPLEPCLAFKKLWNNKFYYKVASCWLFLLIHTAMHGSMNIKFKSITYSERVFVAVAIQNAMRRRCYVVICDLAGSSAYFHIISLTFKNRASYI